MLVFTDEYFIISGNYFRSVCNYKNGWVYIPPNITKITSYKYRLKDFNHERYYYRNSYVKLWHPKSL